MRFELYAAEHLNEKATKRDRKDALSNNNIYIGVEFEFIVHEDSIIDVDDLYVRALDEYDEYTRLVDEATEKISDINAEIDEIDYQIDELEQKRDSLKVVIDDFESSDDNTEYATKMLKKLKQDLANVEYSLKSREQDMAEANDELNSLELPVFDDFENSAYYEYVTNFLHLRAERPEPGEHLEHPITDVADEYSGIIDYILNFDSDILASFPYQNYEIGSYGSISQTKGDSTWAIEDDESLGPYGLEVKSPPMRLPDFVKNRVLDKILDWIYTIGYTDNKCGLHIHLSLESDDKIDMVKLLLFTEEDYIYKIFNGRKYNNYAKSIKTKLKAGSIDKKDIEKVINKDKLTAKISSEHKDGISLIDFTDNHVEFRYMGGDYLNKKDDILNMISVYGYWLSIAVDPEFKKKEYLKKLYKIFMKRESFTLIIKYGILDYIIYKDRYVFNKIYILRDEFEKRYKESLKYTKLSINDFYTMAYEFDFVKEIISDFMKSLKRIANYSLEMKIDYMKIINHIIDNKLLK